DVPAEFFEKWGAFAEHVGTANPWAILVSAVTLLVLVVWPRVSRRVPAPFVALVLATVLVQVADLPVETIESRFGAIRAAFPAPQLPQVTWGLVRDLAPAAFTIAALGAIESLLSAVVADGMIGGRHRSNMELVATGVANIASPL